MEKKGSSFGVSAEQEDEKRMKERNEVWDAGWQFVCAEAETAAQKSLLRLEVSQGGDSPYVA